MTNEQAETLGEVKAGVAHLTRDMAIIIESVFNGPNSMAVRVETCSDRVQTCEKSVSWLWGGLSVLTGAGGIGGLLAWLFSK